MHMNAPGLNFRFTFLPPLSLNERWLNYTLTRTNQTKNKLVWQFKIDS